MIKLLWLCCSCIMLVSVGETSVVGNILEKGFWQQINSACTAVAGTVEKVLQADDIKYLSFIEYRELSIRRHDFYPSAADSILSSKEFDIRRNTVIFIHGFIDNPLLFSGQSFAVAYKVHGDYNILALDSHKLIGMFYLRSSILVKYIGVALARVIDDLVNHGMDIENIHLVGHSLGAHIAGFAGKRFQQLRPGSKLPRITGLDPAGPCFSEVSSDKRLDKEDARFVDVIHTNVGGYGIEAAIGHVDFYPNGGGIQQPGCIESVCSHNRVWQLYEESVVRNKGFIGTQCDSWHSFKKAWCNDNNKSVMGFATSNTTRGLYYMRTNLFPPYGLARVGAKPSIAATLIHLIG